jgi:hypothetical protein
VVTVSDTLPAVLTFDPSNSSLACSAVGQVVSCTPDDAVPATPGTNTVSFTIAVTVGGSVADGTVLENSASVSTDTPESDTTNNTSNTVQTAVVAAGDGATISGRVFLQGRAGSLAGTIITLDNGVDTPITTMTDNTGGFTITLSALGGPYEMSAVHAGYLRAGSSGFTVAAGDSVTLPDVRLLGGDMNGDGLIDILDLSMVAANYGRTGSWLLPAPVTPDIGPSQQPTPDFNDDGVVNILDLSVTAANYDTSSIIPWPAT